MISVEDLCGKGSFPEGIHHFATWEMDINRLSPIHLHALYYRAKQVIGWPAAKAACEAIAREIAVANENGLAQNDRLGNFKIASSPMFLGDLRIGLEKLERVERRCVFLALVMGWSLERVVELTWPEVMTLKHVINDAGWDVLDAMPRHFKSDLVFWEVGNEGVAKLQDVRFKTEMAFGCDYDKLRDRFANMVFIDPELAAEEVRNHFGVMFNG